MISQNELNNLKLQSSLSDFGLNPYEWSLERIHSLAYLLINNVDENFKLYGHLEYREQKPKWKEMEILSL
ncbi:hypothetical protein [Bdellovibrio reynosensis]|uniref:Uncharacterized protein n=1 Tax=Bdellovibrio reynosensis TaxID=2835041 RepID=A0ABY4CGS6_9BACT|nr:hypothetical protein [Bdellovibrio reynosensis]UOF02881.1 hypothetical protein MNR06_07930 [Bdellovibrio reynosensis]